MLRAAVWPERPGFRWYHSRGEFKTLPEGGIRWFGRQRPLE